MRFKTDENLHPEVAAFIREQGYDAVTIWDQALRGAPDDRIADICRAEDRTLVTLDQDFADIRAYPPEDCAGIVVLRVARQDRRHVLSVIHRVMGSLRDQPLNQHLWVVDETSIRIRGPSSDAEQ
ncbi:MAG: hypothetical protein GY778_07495 [bacterium]|nr:hypothetical protein [bacterium]